VEAIEAVRAAYQRRAWTEAYQALSALDAESMLGAADLDRLGTAAYLIGRAEAAADGWERAHRSYLDSGAVAEAVRCAFWLGLTLMLGGEHARGGGWLARAGSVLAEAPPDCVEHAYLRLPAALQALSSADFDTALGTLREVAVIADRVRDPDLMALSRLGQGQALVGSGDSAGGTAMLDEAMLEVTTGDVSPIAAGIIYCAVILACRDIFDLRRAQEWTAQLSRWCAEQPDLAPYRGQCLVHRSEIAQLRGDWAQAWAEAQQAREHLAATPGDPVLGMALYQQAELLRLRGDYAAAERAYQEASGRGHPVQPGLALLRLAQGRLADASAAIHRVAAEAEGPVQCARVLAAYVEIALAAGDTGEARSAADELGRIAAGFGSSYLRAVVGYAHGTVLLVEGDPVAAGAALRRALAGWQELNAPYEAARVRLAMASACRALCDHDTAGLELDAARRAFAELGAEPALAQLRELPAETRRAGPAGRAGPVTAGGLTAREVEVLRLVATGATNRQIADSLVISDKTVARHVANIFAKLDVSSRSAATAYAYQHDLV
jgi:DNA-binding NarL/FixJ family response regulator